MKRRLSWIRSLLARSMYKRCITWWSSHVLRRKANLMCHSLDFLTVSGRRILKLWLSLLTIPFCIASATLVGPSVHPSSLHVHSASALCIYLVSIYKATLYNHFVSENWNDVLIKIRCSPVELTSQLSLFFVTAFRAPLCASLHDPIRQATIKFDRVVIERRNFKSRKWS